MSIRADDHPSQLTKELKRASNLWMKQRGASNADFHWQSGYGAFSVSHLKLNAVKKYIAEQAEHHQKENFQDEYRTMLKKHNVSWDERYVWD